MQNHAPGLPSTSKGIVGQYVNKYGDTRFIHKTRHGLHVLRQKDTVSQTLSRTIAPAIGARLRAARLAAGLSAHELCIKSGLAAAGPPKQRVYELEVGVRKQGMRMGTLYALAAALGIQPHDLLPPLDEMLKAANVSCKRTVSVGLTLK